MVLLDLLGHGESDRPHHAEADAVADTVMVQVTDLPIL